MTSITIGHYEDEDRILDTMNAERAMLEALVGLAKLNTCESEQEQTALENFTVWITQRGTPMYNTAGEIVAVGW